MALLMPGQSFYDPFYGSERNKGPQHSDDFSLLGDLHFPRPKACLPPRSTSLPVLRGADARPVAVAGEGAAAAAAKSPAVMEDEEESVRRDPVISEDSPQRGGK